MNRSYRHVLSAFASALFVLCGSAAISARTQLTFEVASVKRHAEPPHIIGIKISGMRLIADAQTVRGLIMWAYGVKNYQVSGAALASFGDDFYDVVAKAGGETMPDAGQFREMLQGLLAERFHLQVHQENREMPAYALFVGKNGPKLRQSAPDAASGGLTEVVGRNYRITIPRASMDDIIGAVANSFLDRPVIDRTGLNGPFELRLLFTPNTRSIRESDPEPSDISIFAAVQDQLGLRLEPQRAMIKVVVVDHVEKPAAN